MINATHREPQAGRNVFTVKVGQLFEHLLGRETGREQVEHVHDSNAHPAHAGSASALRGIHGDARRDFFHGCNLESSDENASLHAVSDSSASTLPLSTPPKLFHIRSGSMPRAMKTSMTTQKPPSQAAPEVVKP